MFTLFLMIHALWSQNIPIAMDHPIYPFLEKHESLGHLNGEYWSTRPYTYDQIHKMFAEIENSESELSPSDKAIFQRFRLEFNREFAEDGITLPWSRSSLNRLRHPDERAPKPFFISYKQDETVGWINWSENFRVQNNGLASRGYFTDFIGISGQKGRLSFTSEFTLHRLTRNDKYSELPDTYKEGFLLDRDYIKWINWNYPTSSLVYTDSDFSLGIHRQPVYWGYSADNSPILSDNVQSFPYIEWSTSIKHLRFKFMHARLSPNDQPQMDTLNARRNLSAQRVEFDISPALEFAFNEMVVYSHRDFELGYLNPVNFLFAEEQVQGDLDNKLMALDFKWRASPGLTTYGTWFFDELDFWKLFSGWWGNKFVFQLGVTYYPKLNLPSFNLEYTAARPWTYSHRYPVNSFTSAGRILGLQAGPNTETISLNTDWQISPSLDIQGILDFYKRGIDLGSNPLTSYVERGNFENEDQHFIVGDLEYWSNWIISLDYYLSSITKFNMSFNNKDQIELGIKIDW